MANEQIAVTRALCVEPFARVAHGTGARVARPIGARSFPRPLCACVSCVRLRVMGALACHGHRSGFQLLRERNCARCAGLLSLLLSDAIPSGVRKVIARTTWRGLAALGLAALGLVVIRCKARRSQASLSPQRARFTHPHHRPGFFNGWAGHPTASIATRPE
jgi:hypothetical protein